MSIYILSNPADKERFRKRVNLAWANEETVEVVVKKPVRTDNQNRYLHLLINYFSVEYGCGPDEAKVRFFKLAANPDIFSHTFLSPKGERQVLRSTATLTTEEMATAITRFKNWSASEAGIYLPDPEDTKFLAYAEQQIANNKEYDIRGI